MNDVSNMTTVRQWIGCAASVPGGGHLRRGIDCQDASAYVPGEHPMVIALDGRGSSDVSQAGAREGVRRLTELLPVIKPLLSLALDRRAHVRGSAGALAETVFRALVQAKKVCAWEGHHSESDYDFTAAVVIAGRCRSLCLQVGDGTIVARKYGVPRIVFWPEKGALANETAFVRDGGDYRFKIVSAESADAFCVTTDGPMHRLFNMVGMTPGPAFACFFENMESGDFGRDDLLQYLTRPAWSMGTDVRDEDDRSMSLMVRSATVSQTEKH